MTRFRSGLVSIVVVLGVVTAGTLVGPRSVPGSASSEAAPPAETLDTTADSVAQRLLDAHGAQAFASAPYLRFTFAVESPEGTRVVGRHLWDKTTGDYRVEWTRGPDTSYVALVNVRDVTDGVPSGEVYRNGTQLDGRAATEARRQAYGRFINDTYWLLAPLKVRDPGVNRTYLPDSSTATHDVLHLTFGNVGLTPDDEYWLYVSTDTGRLDRWAFHLQSMEASAPPQAFNWTNHVTMDAPAGPVTLATRKEAVDGARAILTNEVALPDSVPDAAFSRPTPMLGEETQ